MNYPQLTQNCRQSDFVENQPSVFSVDQNRYGTRRTAFTTRVRPGNKTDPLKIKISQSMVLEQPPMRGRRMAARILN